MFCLFFALLTTPAICAGAVSPSAVAGAVSGVVTDPSGAKVASAIVHVQTSARATGGPEVSVDALTGPDGRFTAAVPAGVYDVTVVAAGFEPFIATVTVSAKSPAPTVNARLAIATNTETVTVAADNGQIGTDGDANRSALVFNSTTLETFSDDDDTFQTQILALAGGGDPSSPPQVFVNGFSNGRFPPKTSIREVRINQNPYSAQFDALGFGRVEIFTKPGSDTFHGAFNVTGNDNAFNSPNPYAGAQPPYHLLNFDGNLSGPLGSKTSFFTGATYRDQQNNAVVNATSGVDTAGNSVQTIAAIPDPQITQTYSVRLDRLVTATNTLTGRFEFNRIAQTNAGVGQLVLASEGQNTTANTDTLQLSDSQVLGTSMVWETRLQLVHATLAQTAVSSAPTLVVEGAFNGGGSPAQSSTDDQNRVELQEYLSRQQGKHFLRMGARYRLTHEVNASTANFNGQFTFTGIQSYLAAVANPTAGGATLFTLAAGQPSATLTLQDWSAYAEDEWKLHPGITLTLGFRFEGQTGIPDHADPSPRAGIAWAVRQTEKRPAIVVLRLGGAVFYDRFAAANLLTTLHQNGVAQQTYVVTNPAFFCAALTSTCPTQSSLTAQTPAVYNVSPTLHAEYNLDLGFTAERDLWKKGNINVNYIYYRGVHLYNSANVNAPLPGTYDIDVPGSGMRPMGGSQNVYQFQSNGMLTTHRFFMNFNMNPTKRVFLWASGGGRMEHTDSTSATTFASNSYSLAADTGVPSFANRRVYGGGHYDLPRGFDINGFIGAVSGTPFDITTGTDLNGDTEYTDRPAFATDLSRPSVVRTRFGNFDARPIAGQTIIPHNYVAGPAYYSIELGVGKTFRFGPRPPAAAPAAKGPAALPPPRYSLNLSVEAQNVLNHVNPGTPVGVLTSPEFGQSTSLNVGMSANAAANRLLLLRASLNF